MQEGTNKESTQQSANDGMKEEMRRQKKSNKEKGRYERIRERSKNDRYRKRERRWKEEEERVNVCDRTKE